MRPTLDKRIKNRMRQAALHKKRVSAGLIKRPYYATEHQHRAIREFLANTTQEKHRGLT